MNIRPHLILMVFNRPSHTATVLQGIKNAGFKSFTIYMDGANKAVDKRKQSEIFSLISSINWADVKLVRRKKNLRLAKSIVHSVTQALIEHPFVFVLEDDCVPMAGIKEYIDHASNTYSNESKIRSICAYSYPCVNANKISSNTYLLKRFCPWGWGTWRDRWKDYQTNLNQVVSSMKSQVIDSLPSDLRNYSQDQAYLNHTQDIWSINWILAHYSTDTFVLFPKRSLIENIGFDGTGVHSDKTSIFKTITAVESTHLYNKLKSITKNDQAQLTVDNFLLNHSRKTMKFNSKI